MQGNSERTLQRLKHSIQLLEPQPPGPSPLLQLRPLQLRQLEEVDFPRFPVQTFKAEKYKVWRAGKHRKTSFCQHHVSHRHDASQVRASCAKRPCSSLTSDWSRDSWSRSGAAASWSMMEHAIHRILVPSSCLEISQIAGPLWEMNKFGGVPQSHIFDTHMVDRLVMMACWHILTLFVILQASSAAAATMLLLSGLWHRSSSTDSAAGRSKMGYQNKKDRLIRLIM